MIPKDLQTSAETLSSRLPGRPRRDTEPQKRRNITLSDAYAAKAVEIGGSISEGIRQALDSYPLTPPK